MSLKNLEPRLQYKYKRSQDNILEEFLVPCLKESFHYDRAVGFFTSRALRLALSGVIEFIKRGDSKIRLITSPHLNERDIADIKKGLREKKEISESRILEEIEEMVNSGDKTILASLAWLLSRNRLEIKIGDVNLSNHSLFHDKLGIFFDGDENTVVFYGSMNDSYLGYLENYDSIRVLKSWEDTRGKVAEEVEDFEALWSDLDPLVKVYEISEAIEREILRHVPENKEEILEMIEDYGLPLTSKKERRKIERDFNPKNEEPWKPQKRALKKIKENNYSGILKMATGTGKTHTVLFALEQFFKEYQQFGNRIIVIVPTKEIGGQWEEFLEENSGSEDFVFRFDSDIGSKERRDMTRLWKNELGDSNIFIISTVQSLHNLRLSGKTPDLLVADEVHSYGTENNHEKIKEKFGELDHVLGLSATPERYYDPKGTKRVLSYFGPIIFEYDIEDAQEEKKRPGREEVLADYDYYPYITGLTSGEEDEIKNISEKIQRKVAIEVEDEVSEEENRLPDSVMRLMNKRARIMKKSDGKISALEDILRNYGDSLKQCIVYCEDREQLSGVKSTFKEVGIESYLEYHSYISKREETLDLFKRRDIKYVLSMHCLDQGVDIPDCHSAIFMSSSGNPREYIQRRGRILRNYGGKPTVKIFDIFSFPKEKNEMYSGLVFTRLLRAWEFLSCSQTIHKKRKFSRIKDWYQIRNKKLEREIGKW